MTATPKEELLAAAHAYFEQGIPVLPMWIDLADGKKDTNIRWGKWHTRPQTKSEFDSLHIENHRMFAVVCGAPVVLDGETYYLVVVDRDVKDENISPEIKEKTLLAINQMRCTQREKTRSGGDHLVYLSRKPVKGKKLHDLGLELLGTGNLAIMAPSEGYVAINDNTPTVIDDLEEHFYEVLESMGLYKRQHNTQTATTTKAEIKKCELRPCFEKLMERPHLEHLEKVALTYELVHTGKTDEEIRQFFLEHQSWEPAPEHQFSEQETNKRLTYTLDKARQGHFRYTRKKLQELDICYPECPLLDFRDCRKTRQEPDYEERESQADRAVKFALSEDIEFFCDQHHTPYARVTLQANATNASNATFENKTEPPSTYKAIYRLRSTEFRMYLANLMYEREGKVIGSEALNAALNVLHFKAMRNRQITLYNRVAPDPEGNGIWLDMADAMNRAYYITKEGWTLETDVPALFKRYSHQKALPEAVRGGDPWKILNYVNLGKTPSVKVSENASQALEALAKKYRQKKLLFLVDNISRLFPDMPHPVSILHGGAGTFKSTMQIFTRGIIDPSSVPTFGMPKDAATLIQNLEHHYIPIFDNLSTIPEWMSNILCRAVTGEGQEVRALYTDDDVVIREYLRCVNTNGLNIPAQKGDLLSRGLIYETVPMPDQRRTLEELNASYEKDRPHILGGYLDAASSALKLLGSVTPPKTFRLADFTKVGYVLAQALGEDPQDFIDAFEDNIECQHEEITQSNQVAKAFLDWCEIYLDQPQEDSPYTATPETVFGDIQDKADGLKINIKSRTWPKAAHIFTRKLNEARESIASKGWHYEIVHNGKHREFLIWTTEKPAPAKQPTAASKSPMSTAGKCPMCRCVRGLEYMVTYDDRSAVQVCFGCGEAIAKQLAG
jgi:hypothetical protein